MHTHAHTRTHTHSMKDIRERVKKEDVTVKEQSKHASQSDAAKGFGGKYGVQKERQDKVPNPIAMATGKPDNLAHFVLGIPAEELQSTVCCGLQKLVNGKP